MQTQTVEKIVANPATDGIILILNDGTVIAHLFHVFSDDIRSHFQGEVDGTEDLSVYGVTPYYMYANEIEHPSAAIVYTKQDGWLI
ncbi:hypothetical protein vBPFY1MI_102 [Pseudomonas phage vB_PF_Y1-MI]|nr:hypothetical protein vBPFY1MI_102 [Pseudomonas phage vB_PF_Y1-MI]